MPARISFSLLALSLHLAACSSTGGIDTTDPIMSDTGQTGPQRNLLIDNLSFGGAGNNSVSEVFSIGVTSFAVAPTTDGVTDPNGQAPLGLIRGTASRDMIGGDDTLTYTSSSRTLAFDITTDAGTFNRSISNVRLSDPKPLTGLENSEIAQVYGTYLLNNQISNFLGVSDPSNIAEIDAALVALNDADSDQFAVVEGVLSNFIAVDEYVYSFTDGGTSGSFSFTDMNDDTTPGTQNVTMVSYLEVDGTTGEQLHGHLYFGYRTPLEEMPERGTASYTGRLVGETLTNNTVRSMSGGSSVNVNFQTGSVELALNTNIRENDQNGITQFLDYRNVEGTGFISDTTFEGTLSEPNGDATGEFEGAFFGPIANELGGSFAFGNGSFYATGVFTGAQPTN